jgi:4-hydroxy-tetrahydrodipicolinate synthase
VATAQADLLAEIGEVKNDSELFRGSADATRRHPGTGGQARFSAVMVHQPPHPYRSVNGRVAYHQEVAKAVPDLSLVSYVRDPGIGAAALQALAGGCPSLVAVKYAVPDAFALFEAIDSVGADRVTWVCGLAERWAPFHWLSGAQGFTSGVANVASGLALRLLRQLRGGSFEAAMETWRVLPPMAQLGLCRRDVRLPIVTLDQEESDEVEKLRAAWRVSAPIDGHAETTGAHA